MLTKKGNSKMFKLWVIFFSFTFQLQFFFILNYWQYSVTLLSNGSAFDIHHISENQNNVPDFSQIGYRIAL